MTVGLAGDVPPSFVFKISRYCQELVLDRISPTMQGVMSSCVEYRCDKMWSNESEYVVSDGDDIYPAETLASALPGPLGNLIPQLQPRPPNLRQGYNTG